MAGPEDRKVVVPKAATPAQTKAFTGGVDKAQADFNKSLADAKSTLAAANKAGNKVVAASARGLIDQLNTVVKPALAILQKAENPNAAYTGEITPINQALGGGAAGSGPSGVILGSGGKGAYSLDEIRSYMNDNNGSLPPDLNLISSGISNADLSNVMNQYKSDQVSPKTGTGTGTGTGVESATKRMDAIAAITALLSSYGIGDLSASITDAVVKGYSSDTIQLIMQDPNSKDPLAVAFQTRFPANKTRLAAGKSVLSAAEYLQAERSYTQVMQSYGVSNLATRDKLNAFIANDVSATEVADRVGLAIDRVKNADPETKAALALYYPTLNQSDIVGAVLDPAEGLPALQRKVQIAEIGGAALAQGLKTTNMAGQLQSIDIKMGQEALASLGVTKKQAQEGFATVAEITPRAQFLSDISTGEDYTQLQAEQETFQGLASAKRARLSLTEQEKARFGGASGLSKASLTQQRSGLI